MSNVNSVAHYLPLMNVYIIFYGAITITVACNTDQTIGQKNALLHCTMPQHDAGVSTQMHTHTYVYSHSGQGGEVERVQGTQTHAESEHSNERVR